MKTLWSRYGWIVWVASIALWISYDVVHWNTVDAHGSMIFTTGFSVFALVCWCLTWGVRR